MRTDSPFYRWRQVWPDFERAIWDRVDEKGKSRGRAWRRIWPGFTRQLWQRLDDGKKTYGDDSFSQRPTKTLGEIKQEVLDIVGWTVVEWDNLDRLKERGGLRRNGLLSHIRVRLLDIAGRAVIEWDNLDRLENEIKAYEDEAGYKEEEEATSAPF